MVNEIHFLERKIYTKEKMERNCMYIGERFFIEFGTDGKNIEFCKRGCGTLLYLCLTIYDEIMIFQRPNWTPQKIECDGDILDITPYLIDHIQLEDFLGQR